MRVSVMDVEDISGESVCVCDEGTAVVLGCDRQPVVPLLKRTTQTQSVPGQKIGAR